MKLEFYSRNVSKASRVVPSLNLELVSPLIAKVTFYSAPIARDHATGGSIVFNVGARTSCCYRLVWGNSGFTRCSGSWAIFHRSRVSHVRDELVVEPTP